MNFIIYLIFDRGIEIYMILFKSGSIMRRTSGLDSMFYEGVVEDDKLSII